jgi:hypothetical protein
MKNKAKLVTMALITAGLLIGCGSSGNSSKKVGYKGVFVDSIVAGLPFSCGNIKGTTDAKGIFGECPSGSKVTFSIGKIKLGTVAKTSDNIYTPLDLAGVARKTTDNKKTNPRDLANLIASLLLSLNTSGNPSKGITITPEVIMAFEGAMTESKSIADMTEATVAEAITKTSDALPITLEVVTVEEAAAHLAETEDAIENGEIKAPEQRTETDESTN